MLSPMEVIFVVRERETGGYTARAPAHSIVAAGESWEVLRENARVAAALHFKDAPAHPTLIRLHMVKDDVIAPSPGGDLSSFESDPKFAQQCFITSEPLAAKRKGIAVKVFPVSDIGFNPYANVMATSEDVLKKNAAMVESMVKAVREGWRTYLDDPKAANAKMHELNPSMDEATFAEVAEAQKPFIEDDDTKQDGLGTMNKQRWETLIGQLKDLGDIPMAIPAEDCFRNL